MSRSVCLNCGEIKLNPFISCEKCGYEPATLEDKAKHLLCSESVGTIDMVIQVSEAIKEGKEIVFPKADVKKVSAMLKKQLKQAR